MYDILQEQEDAADPKAARAKQHAEMLVVRQKMDKMQKVGSLDSVLL